MKRLLFTFLSFFITVLTVALPDTSKFSSSGTELLKAKDSGNTTSDIRTFNDSLNYAALIAEIDALRKQLKAKSDTSQIRQVSTDSKLAQLKAKFDSNQAQIDQLMVESAKAKIAKTISPSTTENALLMDQLKIKLDNNQVQIEKLIVELAKTKEEVAKTSKMKTLNLPLPNPVESATGTRTTNTDGFVDEKGDPAPEGFYVVIGAFGNKENADRFKALNIIKGHENTEMIQNQVTKMYNIFVLKTNNRNDADYERIKSKEEYSNVWVLKLEKQ